MGKCGLVAAPRGEFFKASGNLLRVLGKGPERECNARRSRSGLAQ